VKEAVMALCCLYGFLLEGFISFGLAIRLLTVFVTIPGHFWCYGAVVYDLNHLWVTAFHLVVGLFYVIVIYTVGYDGYYSKRLSLGLVAIT
jgi:hypothetical protein